MDEDEMRISKYRKLMISYYRYMTDWYICRPVFLYLKSKRMEVMKNGKPDA